MSKHTINSVQKTQVTIKTSDDEWIFGEKSNVTLKGANAHGIFVGKGFDGNTLDFSGQVTVNGDMAADLFILGNNNVVTVEAAAKFMGNDVGLATEGSGTVFNNLGSITAAKFGIFAVDPNVTITNSGEISASDVQGAGVVFGAGHLTNKSGGTIYGKLYGIDVAGNMHKTFVNKGTISSDGDAIYDNQGGHLAIKNQGTIDGDVWLGTGTGVIDTRTGTLHGTIHGSDGDTTFLISNANQKIVEDSDHGTDTVKSTVSYTLGDNIENLVLLGKANVNATGNATDNHLTGNAGNNTISGGAGLDVLDGGKGNDVLTGGDDQDNFVFDKGNGVDTITDFVHGSDYINILKFSQFTDFDGLSSHISQHHKDTWIDLGGGDKVILHHFDSTTLTADDFVFA